jgi:hypothetical protein
MFLWRSRHQKLPYKQIARRLDKSVLACRMHYHQMVVGRKRHNVAEHVEGQSLTEEHLSSMPLGMLMAPVPSEQGYHTPESSYLSPSNAIRRTRGDVRLPSFDTLVRDILQQQGSSSPENPMDRPTSVMRIRRDTGVSDSYNSRLARTLSGTQFRETGEFLEDHNYDRERLLTHQMRRLSM